MGLFSSRKVYTDTAVFNLAGEFNDRPNFRKTQIIGGILQDVPSLGGHIVQSYLKGPGMRLRSYQRWAENNMGGIGVPGQVYITTESAIAQNVADLINVPGFPDATVNVLEVVDGPADYGWWARQHVFQFYSHLARTEWTSDIDPATDEITITFEDSSTTSFFPADFISTADYFYATYLYEAVYTQDPTRGIFIYRIGSGNVTLDALYQIDNNPSETFIAPIPVRLDGEFLGENGYRPDISPIANRALKKSVGAPLSEIVSTIKDNEDVESMDYVHVVFGASANTRDETAKNYMFTFFKSLANEPGAPAQTTSYAQWLQNTTVLNIEYDTWRDEAIQFDEGPATGPIVIDNPMPFIPNGNDTRPTTKLKITNTANYRVEYEWSSMVLLTGTGLSKPGAEIGEVWFSQGLPDNALRTDVYDTNDGLFSQFGRIDRVFCTKQLTANSWETIEITGLVQKTYAYRNNFEELNFHDEIFDRPDRNNSESAFLIPIRYNLFIQMDLATSTQFALACSYIQVHAYEIVNKGFFQSSFFKIFSVALVIGVTIATGGVGGAASGVLGTNASVGAALGLSGVAGAIAGAAINAIAALVITTIVTKISTEILGDKIGAIVGAALSFIAVNGLTNFAGGNGFVINFGQISKADTIMSMTKAVSTGVQGYIQADIEDILQANKDFTEEYLDAMENLSNAYAENIGYDKGVIDPMAFLNQGRIFAESPEAFFGRTLMTGSDIAELTMMLLSNFSQISLDLDPARVNG